MENLVTVHEAQNPNSDKNISHLIAKQISGYSGRFKTLLILATKQGYRSNVPRRLEHCCLFYDDNFQALTQVIVKTMQCEEELGIIWVYPNELEENDLKEEYREVYNDIQEEGVPQILFL